MLWHLSSYAIGGYGICIGHSADRQTLAGRRCGFRRTAIGLRTDTASTAEEAAQEAAQASEPAALTQPAAASSDSASCSQQPGGCDGADYCTAQSFSQGEGSAGQPHHGFTKAPVTAIYFLLTVLSHSLSFPST